MNALGRLLVVGLAAGVVSLVSASPAQPPNDRQPAQSGAGAGTAALPAAPPPADAPAARSVVGEDWSAKDVSLVLGQLLAAFVAGAAVWASLMNTRRTIAAAVQTSEAQRWREANQAEIQHLEGVLREFHTPYLVRSGANNNVAQDLRSRLNEDGYRMLISLFDPTWLPNLPIGDQTIVREVCTTGLELKAFIEDHSQRVDAGLAEHLSRAAVHFRMLHLAYERKLGEDPKPFEPYVYPRELDLALEFDRERIRKRLEVLRARPSTDHGLIAPLVLPAEAALPKWPDPVRRGLPIPGVDPV